MKTVNNSLILLVLCAALTACTEAKTGQQSVTDQAAATTDFASSFQPLSQVETSILETVVLTSQKPDLLEFQDTLGSRPPKEDNCGQCHSAYAIELNADEAVLLINMGGNAVLPPMAAYRVTRRPPYQVKRLLLPGLVEAAEQKQRFPHIGHNLSIDTETGVITQHLYNDQPIPDCEDCGDIEQAWRFDGKNFQLAKTSNQ